MRLYVIVVSKIVSVMALLNNNKTKDENLMQSWI